MNRDEPLREQLQTSAEARRLEELQRATREYARFANVSGIPLALVAAWLLAGVLTMPSVASRALLLTAPVVWAIAATASPLLYVRYGVVSAASRRVRRSSLVFCYLMAPIVVLQIARSTWYRNVLPTAAAVAVASGGVILVMAVAHKAARVAADVGLLSWVFILASYGAEQVQDLGYLRWFWAVLSAGAVLFGVLAHLRFRTLERSMRELRERLR